MTTFYIAGPMRGYRHSNFPAFDECAAWLRQWSYDVISPAEHDRETGFDETIPVDDQPFDLKAALMWDLGQVASVDALALLPGWSASSGVAAELALARALDIIVYEYLPQGITDRESRLRFLKPGSSLSLDSPGVSLVEFTDETICAEADRLVSNERQAAYGHPIDDFTRTGRMWGAILGTADIPAALVGLCMVAVKVSREVNKPKRDNLVDMAGYAKTIDLVREVEGR